MEVTDAGVPLGSLIEAVKASVQQAGISRTAQMQDMRVASVQLILEAVASETAGGGLDFRVPFIGMKLRLGAKVTKKDTHTLDITLVPPENVGREVRGSHDVQDALANAIASIRAVTSKAAEGDDPWVLAESTIDITFAITRAGTISLGVDGDLSHDLTHTLRLQLKPQAQR